MFKRAFNSQRCLVPAGWYFEWKKDGAKKEKYMIRGKEPLFMAGLYKTEADTELPRFVIQTRPASPELSFIHDRMPVIMPEEDQYTWLNGNFNFDLSKINAEHNICEKVSSQYSLADFEYHNK